MEDFMNLIFTPPANLLMWLLFSREGAEIMPDLLLFSSVAIMFSVLWGYRMSADYESEERKDAKPRVGRMLSAQERRIVLKGAGDSRLKIIIL